jgi:hypothetical protein
VDPQRIGAKAKWNMNRGIMFKKSKRESVADVNTGDESHECAKSEQLSPPEAGLSYEHDDAPAGSAEETARYIADMVGALAAMAGDAKLDLLTYLLNMARVEAELQARQSETLTDDPKA